MILCIGTQSASVGGEPARARSTRASRAENQPRRTGRRRQPAAGSLVAPDRWAAVVHRPPQLGRKRLANLAAAGLVIASLSVPSVSPAQLVVAVLLALWLGPPATTLFHELAHAGWGLLKTKQPVYVLMNGARGGSRAIRFGRLYLAAGRGGLSRAHLQREQMGRWAQAGCAASGPAAGLAASALMMWAAVAFHRLPLLAWWLLLMAAVGLLNAAWDLWPRRHGRQASDGWVIANVLRGGSGIPRPPWWSAMSPGISRWPTRCAG
jgi:hypothetical protein